MNIDAWRAEIVLTKNVFAYVPAWEANVCQVTEWRAKRGDNLHFLVANPRRQVLTGSIQRKNKDPLQKKNKNPIFAWFNSKDFFSRAIFNGLTWICPHSFIYVLWSLKMLYFEPQKYNKPLDINILFLFFQPRPRFFSESINTPVQICCLFPGFVTL